MKRSGIYKKQHDSEPDRSPEENKDSSGLFRLIFKKFR